MSDFFPPESITKVSPEQLTEFCCREESLNTWLCMRALKNEKIGASRTFIVRAKSGKVAGYFCLSSGALAHTDLKAFYKRNMPDPVPVVLLGRFAVDRHYERRGLGASMLQSALRFTEEAALRVGTNALVTEPISESAKAFYLKCGFKEAKTGGSLLILPIQNQN